MIAILKSVDHADYLKFSRFVATFDKRMWVLGATDLAVPGQWHPSHESPHQSHSVISFENCYIAVAGSFFII
jgi:hypothetical protein